MKCVRRISGWVLAWLAVLVAAGGAIEPCRIDVTDEASGWPVPLVELRTTHSVRFVSDNAGVIAFDLPELMGEETWFFVEGHGYEVKKDGFGYRGVRLTPVPGGRLSVKVRRVLPGKRLGRITGAGLFGESQKLGLESGWKEQGILGKKWLAVFTQRGGDSSHLGEIWYAEAGSPFGPWGGAVKVVTHANYSFYNPRLHPEFTEAGSAVLLFEGTYTRTFAKHAEATPRHDYNQVLYRLDLDDPELLR